jgi:plastocyanin
MSTHLPPRAALLAGLATLALVLVGCAGEAKGLAGPVATNEVAMPRSYRFAPEVIQIPAGTAVTWRNEDNFTHSVRLRDGSEPDHLVKPGETVTITFTQPGEYRYDCSLHPRDMSGKVLVTGS